MVHEKNEASEKTTAQEKSFCVQKRKNLVRDPCNFYIMGRMVQPDIEKAPSTAKRGANS